MIRFLRRINRFFEGLSILLVPVIIFYWFLNIIDLPFFKSIANMIGYLLKPLLLLVKFFGNFQINYEGSVIDLNPLVLAGILFIIFFSFSGIEKILNLVEESLNRVKIKIQESNEQKIKELLYEKYLQDLAKNRIIYVVLKLNKKTMPASYLYDKEEDFFSEGILNKMISKTLDGAEQYDGKKFKDFEPEEGYYNYIFYEVPSAIDFAFFVNNMIIEINKDILDLSERMSFSIGMYCSVSEASAPLDFAITTKILDLGSNNEILVAEVFKNKYQAMKSESNIAFDSYGIYAIDDQQLELFKLKVDN